MRTVAAVSILVMALISPIAAQADVVTDWNNVVLDSIRAEKSNPPRASRALAMVHAAIYDAVNAIDGTHERYVSDEAAPEGASKEAAIIAAAHQVLVSLFPARKAIFDGFFESSLAGIKAGKAKDDGVALGQAVGNDILAWRADDGSATVVPYTPGTTPGEWQPTPAAFAAALLPNWPYVKPFALASGSQFRSSGPPPLSSQRYADACNDVKVLGSKTSSVRTADQTQIALFWADGGGTQTPPGHWNTIAQGVAAMQGNTLEQNARLFALLNIALADAAISAWDTKYTYNHWRCVTAIRNAHLDGNDQTEQDAAWEPLIATPPFPEYTSGHSTFSAAAARVLERFYGTDNIAFSTVSDGLPGVTRSFTGFSKAAAEAGRSRIYGGIHFEYSNQDGQAAGQQIGTYVYDNYLKPIPEAGVEVVPFFPCGPFGFVSFAATFAMLTGLRVGMSGRRRW